jgi:hypothetical protein
MSRNKKTRRAAAGTQAPRPGAAGQMTVEHGLEVTSKPVSTIELDVDDILELIPDPDRAAIERAER